LDQESFTVEIGRTIADALRNEGRETMAAAIERMDALSRQRSWDMMERRVSWMGVLSCVSQASADRRMAHHATENDLYSELQRMIRSRMGSVDHN
jgi:hypothetical protein